MKFIFLISFIAVTVSAAPAAPARTTTKPTARSTARTTVKTTVKTTVPPKTDEKPPVEIIESTFEKSADGSYTYKFVLSDGYVKEEKGVAVNPGEENSPVDVTGFYRYIDDEGEPIEVHYTANQYGFVPEGSRIQPEITNNARTLVEAKARELKV